jgi:hypothetical protein
MKDLVQSCKRSKALVKLRTLARDIRESRSVQKIKELSKEYSLDKCCFIRTSSIASPPFVPLLSDFGLDHSSKRSLANDFPPLKQLFSLLFKRMQFSSRYSLWVA